MIDKETVVRHGGVLQVGDFVAIAQSHYIEFGWFCGRGQGGTFQYYHYISPSSAKERYEHAKLTPSNWNHKKAINFPFSLKFLLKSYLTGFYPKTNRIIKINDPREFFDEEDFQSYEKSKQILEELNFLKK